jgi:hypothetical protein
VFCKRVSPVTVETRKIILARVAGLYASFPKNPKAKKVKDQGTE